MYTSILVPLDGSTLAEQALPYAEQIAKAGGARLLLTRVAHSPGFLFPDAEAAPYAAAADADAYLVAIERSYSARGLQVSTQLVEGAPGRAIVEAAAEHSVDLIVMATHARRGLDGLTRGSVAREISAHSSVPVFMVQAPDTTTRAEVLKIVVPLDGSQFAETAALPAALRLASSLKAPICLVQVVGVPSSPVSDQEGQVIAYVDQIAESSSIEAKDYLDTVARWVAERMGGTVPETTVLLGDPARAISELAEEQSAYVVMATHGRSGVARALFGNVALGVLEHCHRPLMLVPPTAVAPVEAGSAPAIARA